MKFFQMLFLAIIVSLPMVREGNTVYDVRGFYGAKQINKYVILMAKNQIDQVQLVFDSALEANHFIDTFANWLSKEK